MDINKILVPGETVIYRPKLHWFAYWSFGNITRNLTTSIFLSNKRFFYGHGLLRRHTHELVIGKIETINVRETLMGRIFGYGAVEVSGTGAGTLVMDYVRRPFELQRQLRSVQ